jgi:AcrR family transcriptional regulator
MHPQSLRTRLKETVAETILDATEEIASESGHAATSIQAIAQRAGVSVGTIYNYFADRNGVMAELFTRRRSELLAKMAEAARDSAGGTFARQLDAFVRTVFTFFDARRPFLRLAIETGPQVHAAKKSTVGEGGRSTLEQLLARAERIVAVGIKEGKVRKEGADLSAAFLISAIKTVLAMRAATDLPLAAQTDEVIALFLNGVAVRR